MITFELNKMSLNDFIQSPELHSLVIVPTSLFENELPDTIKVNKGLFHSFV